MKTDFYKAGLLVTWAALFSFAAIIGGCGSSEPVASSTPNSAPAPPPGAPGAPGPEADPAIAPPAAAGAPAEMGMDPAMEPGMDPAMEMGMDPSMTPGMDPTMEMGMDPTMGMDPAMGMDGAAMGYGEPMAAGYGGAGGYAGGGGQFGPGAGMLVNSLAAASQIESTRFPTDYWGQAELAFKQGYEALAAELLYAHLATEPVAAAERYEQVRLSRALGRPTWVVRWGLSLSVRGADGYSGDTQPITSDLRPGNPGGAGSPMEMQSPEMAMREPGMGGPGMGGPGAPGAPAAGGNPSQAALGGISLDSIEEHLGLFATMTAENFDQRFAAGDYSPTFAALMPKPIVAAPQTPGDGYAAGDMGMLAGDPGLGMIDPAMGMADAAMGMNDAAMGMNDPAMGMGGMMGGNARMRAAEAKVSTIAALPQPHPRWRPGIVYLGELGYQEAIQAASEAGIDFLIHFDVSVEERRRTEEIVNETRARVVNVHRPEQQVGGSRKLSNLDVKNRLRLRENASRGNESRGNAAAPAGVSEDIPRQMVAEALAPLFGAIDRELKLVEMPALTEVQARARVGSLITASVATPLRALAEFQLYRSLGLLTDEEMIAATELLMGDDGLRLLVGNEAERREVLTELRPRLTAYGELGMEPPVAEPESKSNANRPPGRF